VKRLLVFVLAVVMMFSVMSCSSPGEPTEPDVPDDYVEGKNEDNESEEKEEAENGGKADGDISDDFMELISTFDLASYFSELEYTYSVTDASGQEDVAEYAFYVLDEKIVDGMTAYQISFARSKNGTQSVTECWVNEKQVLAVIKDGEEITEEFTLMQTNTTLNNLMAPFMFTVVFEEILMEPHVRTIMGWTLEDEGTKAASMNGKSYTVYYYELSSKSDETAYLEVVSIEGKNTFLNYENTQDGRHFMFNIDHMTSR
jgi:hypothetical protein